MYVLPKRGRGVRFGFTTVKKVGKAVERNRVKRLLRESARGLIQQVRSPADIVVVARARAAEATFAELRAEMAKLLEKCELLGASKEEKT